MPFSIIRQDITRMHVDAIVNAANTDLMMGGGVCGAIFSAAGADRLQDACDRLAPIRTGEAVITPGFDLPARYVIHTAGPVYDAADPKQSEKLLDASYRSSLRLAAENGCESIAFPLISSGIYGYPKDGALRVATRAIRAFLEDSDMDVFLVVFGSGAFAESRRLVGDVKSYIDAHYADSRDAEQRCRFEEKRSMWQSAPEAVQYNASAVFSERDDSAAPHAGKAQKRKPRLEDVIGNLDEPFSETLLRLIDAKGCTDVAVYKRANLDRKLFSKIRIGKGYVPGKRIVLALAIALELDLHETGELLARAGYALSHAQKFDVIVEYFILNGQYDIFSINEVLFQYDQPLLGG